MLVTFISDLMFQSGELAISGAIALVVCLLTSGRFGEYAALTRLQSSPQMAPAIVHGGVE